MSMILLQVKPSARATDGLHVVHPPPATPRYLLEPPKHSSRHIPSLSWLCIRRLAEFPDQLYHLPVRLRVADDAPLAVDIANAVHDPETVDPRLWATLVQVYDNLPVHLASFSTPLADPHIPLLQRIPATPRFTLLTVLDLPACTHLTDDTVRELTRLHSLTALDASATALSSYAVTVLARTLHWSIDHHRRGLWGLRILRLRGCTAIENSVYPQLTRFPLLSVVDLRGTNCTPTPTSVDAFCPADATQLSLYHPASLRAALRTLSSPTPLYSSPHTFTLHINSLYHGPPSARLPQPTVAPQNTFVVIPSAESHSAIKTGDSEAMRRHAERAEELDRRKENKEAWYARNPECNTEPLWDGPDTGEATNSSNALSGSNGDRRSSLRRSDAFKSLPPISRSTTYLSPPSKCEDKTPQHPIASTSTFHHIPLDIRAAQRKPTTLASSSWIGNHHTQSCTRTSLPPLPVRPMPRSSFSGSSSSAPPMQRPLISASTAAFYSTVPTNPRVPDRRKLKHHVSGWDWDYSADRYYSEGHPERQGEHDPALMLYRPPPPWADLPVEGIISLNACGTRMGTLAGGGILRVRHVEKVAAVSDQKRIEAVKTKEGEKQAALVALQESAKRHGGVLASMRRRGWHGNDEIGTPIAGNTNTGLGTTMDLGRNPFRRRVDVNIGGIGGEMTKPLKPISAVKIPLFPKNALERESKRRKTVSNVKTSKPLATCKDPSSNTNVIVTAHKLRPTRVQAGDEKATRRKSTASLSSEPGHGIKGTDTSQQEFNWSN